jgi:endo-1,4-beta-xylanase
MRSVSALTLDEAEFAEQQQQQTDATTLQSVAATACKKVLIGTAVMPTPLFHEPAYAATVRHEFNSIIVEHHLKWEPLLYGSGMPAGTVSPQTLGRYDFTTVDRIVDWAVAHDMHVKGHVLIWHVTSPTALLSETCETSEQLRLAMQRHIHTTMAHFRGRITDWDVVNEALAPDGSLAENIFWQSLGPGYIADCFRWAAAADPSARLFYK